MSRTALGREGAALARKEENGGGVCQCPFTSYLLHTIKFAFKWFPVTFT